MQSLKIIHNVRVYEPLRCQSAYLSKYTNVSKRDNLRKPSASNGLYTLLAPVHYYIVLIFCFLKVSKALIRPQNINEMIKTASPFREYNIASLNPSAIAETFGSSAIEIALNISDRCTNSSKALQRKASKPKSQIAFKYLSLKSFALNILTTL